MQIFSCFYPPPSLRKSVILFKELCDDNIIKAIFSKLVSHVT